MISECFYGMRHAFQCTAKQGEILFPYFELYTSLYLDRLWCRESKGQKLIEGKVNVAFGIHDTDLKLGTK